MSVLCLDVMWLAMNLIAWLNYEPKLIDLANVFLPLMLLPLISSAYAEVNQEGLRLLKVGCVCLQSAFMTDNYWNRIVGSMSTSLFSIKVLLLLEF